MLLQIYRLLHSKQVDRNPDHDQSYHGSVRDR